MILSVICDILRKFKYSSYRSSPMYFGTSLDILMYYKDYNKAVHLLNYDHHLQKLGEYLKKRKRNIKKVKKKST